MITIEDVFKAMSKARLDSRYSHLIKHEYQHETLQVKMGEECTAEKIPVHRRVR